MSFESEPEPGKSKSLKASIITASASVLPNLDSNKLKKAGKLSGPLASATMALSSESLTLVPNSSKHAFNSFVSMVPSPSLSITPKAFFQIYLYFNLNKN